MKEAINEFSRVKPIDERSGKISKSRFFTTCSEFHEDEGYEKLKAVSRTNSTRAFGTQGQPHFLSLHTAKFFPFDLPKNSTKPG